MTLGVIVFHTARIFDPYPYYVKASEQSAALAPLILFGVLWGMPLFFLVAGFALWHSLGSRGAANVVRERGKRLLLPLAVGLLTLVPFQIYVSRIASGEHISYLTSMREYLDVHLTFQLPFPVQGLWFDYSHLWFVAYLFSFSVMLVPFVVWARRRPQLRLSAGAAIAIWVAAIVVVAGLEAWIGMEGTGAWDRWSYLIVMALGVLIAWQPIFGEVLTKRVNVILSAAFLGFGGLCLAVALMHADAASLTNGGAPAMALWRAAKSVVGMLILMAIVGSISAYKSAPQPVSECERKGRFSTFLGYISPISLPLYMLHLTLILVMAYFVLEWPLPAVAQFLAIVALTLAAAFAIVEAASRSRIGCLLLGMKPRPRVRPAPSRPRVPEQEPEPARAPAPALVSSH